MHRVTRLRCLRQQHTRSMSSVSGTQGAKAAGIGGRGNESVFRTQLSREFDLFTIEDVFEF